MATGEGAGVGGPAAAAALASGALSVVGDEVLSVAIKEDGSAVLARFATDDC